VVAGCRRKTDSNFDADKLAHCVIAHNQFAAAAVVVVVAAADFEQIYLELFEQ
jgi:hypothetical protein